MEAFVLVDPVKADGLVSWFSQHRPTQDSLVTRSAQTNTGQSSDPFSIGQQRAGSLVTHSAQTNTAQSSDPFSTNQHSTV